MNSSPAFIQHLELCAIHSLEKQHKLLSLLGDHQYELDLDAGTIRMNALTFPMQILGTESDNTLSWLWAWADEQSDVQPELLKAAERMRAWGAEKGVIEFTTPSVDLATADGRGMTLIAAAICGADAWYRDIYDGGALSLLLYSAAIARQPSFTRAELVLAMQDLFEQFDIHQRRSLLAYLTLKGRSPLDDGRTLSCELESGERLNVEFDEQGRLRMINGTPFSL